MKLTFTLILIMIISSALYADIDLIPSQITDFVEAWNQNSLAKAEHVISSDYRIPGVPTEMSMSVLQQAFAGNEEKLKILSYQGSSKLPAGTRHNLLVEREREVREMYFVIDSSDEIRESNIFAVEVRRISQETNQAVSEYIVIPFELHNDMILLQGSLNGEPAHFLLDSGAPVFVLNSQYQPEEGQIKFSTASGVGGKVGSMSSVRIEDMAWPGGEYHDKDVISMDLSSLENKLERAFAGLISYAELEPYETYIDYEAQEIHLWALDDAGNIISQDNLPAPNLQIHFELQAHIPIIDCVIGELNLKMGIDTGAQSNLLDESFMPRLGNLISAVETDTLIGADAREIEIQSAEIKEIMVYGENFGKMRYAFSDISHLSEAYKVEISGLLGKPMLSQRPFSINYRSRMLKLF